MINLFGAEKEVGKQTEIKRQPCDRRNESSKAYRMFIESPLIGYNYIPPSW